MKIGCIGQGFVGKNTADDFENRGYEVVRYALEPEFKGNKNKISECDVVFVGVPTPTTPSGFDYSIVKDVIALVSDEAIVVIKSTLLPGTTKKLQEVYENKIVLFSPEFLSEKTAAFDAANPIMNIVGISEDTLEQRQSANMVIEMLPKSEHNFVVSSQSAEIMKYAHNLNGYFRIILANLLFEVSEIKDANWEEIKPMMDSDIMMSPYYNEPSHKGGRGAGGNCFVKDMAAFRHLYEKEVIDDKKGLSVLEVLEEKNIELLRKTNKSEDIIDSVYGNKK